MALLCNGDWTRALWTQGTTKGSLTNIKSFISSFGVITADFFDQSKLKGGWPGGKSGSQPKGKSKDTPKGTQPEEQLPKRGKSQGKRDSANKPKEPASQNTRLLQIHQNSRMLQVNQKDQRLRTNQRSQLFPGRQPNWLIHKWKSQWLSQL